MMRARTMAIGGLAGAAAAVAWWRRRRRAAPSPAAQIGRGDGSVLLLAGDDPRTPALCARAAELRAALEAPR